MERYSKYRDSGIQWLGQIPGHWKTIRVKSLLSERIDKSDTGKEEPLSMSQKYGIIPTKDMDVVPNMASTYVGAKKVFKNDLVFNKLKAHLGVFAISKYEGLVSPDYAVYTPNERTYLPFMEYMFHTPLYIGEFTRKATGVAIGLTRLYTNGLFAIPFLYPPIEEQHAIVSFLDDRCGKIDKMLEGKQKQIELLAEMKQRIMADAVTRGLNPNVKMKATNIPWLPEIPDHWTVKRGKNLFNKEQRPIEEGDDIVTCFRDGEVTLRKNRRTTGFTEATDYSHYQHICKGDLVIHQMDAFAGSSGVSDSDGMGTPVLSVCTAKVEGLNHYYYAYILRLMGKNNFILSLYRGIRERSSDFRFETFAKQYLPVPPASEQNEIVEFINERSSKIDTLTSKLQQEIESIKEYKQRLISDAVTGQIKIQ